MSRHDAISAIARQMWLEAGRPQGQDERIWYAAEVEYNTSRRWFYHRMSNDVVHRWRQRLVEWETSSGEVM